MVICLERDALLQFLVFNLNYNEKSVTEICCGKEKCSRINDDTLRPAFLEEALVTAIMLFPCLSVFNIVYETFHMGTVILLALCCMRTIDVHCLCVPVL